MSTSAKSARRRNHTAHRKRQADCACRHKHVNIALRQHQITQNHAHSISNGCDWMGDGDNALALAVGSRSAHQTSTRSVPRCTEARTMKPCHGYTPCSRCLCMLSCGLHIHRICAANITQRFSLLTPPPPPSHFHICHIYFLVQLFAMAVPSPMHTCSI